MNKSLGDVVIDQRRPLFDLAGLGIDNFEKRSLDSGGTDARFGLVATHQGQKKVAIIEKGRGAGP